MIWAKTVAGRAEMQARALVGGRAQRNLLLVIDGRKTDEMLLEHLAGISASDFLMLQSLGLIAHAPSEADAVHGASNQSPVAAALAEPGPSSGPAPAALAAVATAATASRGSAPPATPAPATSTLEPVDPTGVGAGAGAGAAADVPLDYGQFTAALTQIISRELGLRGFMLTLAVEKASTPEELRAVAERAVAQVRERRGEASAAAASRALFGA